MIRKILLFCLLFFLTSLSAQQKLDSLYSVWQDENQKDSLRIKAYHNFIWKGSMFSNPDSALVMAEELLNFTEKKKFSWAIANTLHLKAHAYYVKGDFDKALELYFQSIDKRDRELEKRQLAASFGNMANIYKEKADYISALKYEKESLALSREIEDKAYVAVSLNNLGVIYSLQGLYSKALDYFVQAWKIREEIGDRQRIATSLNNIAYIYGNMGEHDKAVTYLKDAVSIREEGNNKFELAANMTNLAVQFNELNRYDSALVYHQKSLKLTREMGDKNGTAWVLHNLGYLHYAMGNLSDGANCFKESLVIMREIGNQEEPVYIRSLIALGQIAFDKKQYNTSIEQCIVAKTKSVKKEILKEQKMACDCLYKSYKAIGNSEQALQYHEQSLALNDSLNAAETSKKLQQMEFAKQVLADSLLQVEKDLQVEMAHQEEVRKKDRNRNLTLGAGIFFLVLSGGFYSRWRYVRKSKKIIEKEKDRSDNLLLNILPSEIAEELKAKGSVDARDFDQVSVLFTDFKGFTTRSEKLSARELVQEINLCFKAFDHICGEYNIEKIKTIGDAYMAGGGLPVPSADAVKNTVLAALEMQDFMEKRAMEKKVQNEIPFEMRVGIHTGPVVAGIVGVKKFQYDIWGDTVNTASRMESSGEVGQVNISQDTYEIIKDDSQFSFTSRGKINAKGKGEVEMFFVTKKAPK